MIGEEARLFFGNSVSPAIVTLLLINLPGSLFAAFPLRVRIFRISRSMIIVSQWAVRRKLRTFNSEHCPLNTCDSHHVAHLNSRPRHHSCQCNSHHFSFLFSTSIPPSQERSTRVIATSWQSRSESISWTWHKSRTTLHHLSSTDSNFASRAWYSALRESVTATYATIASSTLIITASGLARALGGGTTSCLFTSWASLQVSAST